MKRVEPTIPSERLESSPCEASTSEDILAESRRQDPLRRFTPTPYATGLPAMGRTVQLETNALKILEHATELFASYPGAPDKHAEFLWRIVVQPHPQMTPPWPKRFAFSDHGLRFAEFGQSNFLAVDLEAREGGGFLAEGLMEDKLALAVLFLDNIFCMTAGSLGLVPLRANCVALNHKGLLLFGDPNSGKTTASYVAAKLGLEFHADDGVFVEVKAGELLAWGGFWPVSFRPHALQFFPELQRCARPFSYCDFTFYHLEKWQFQYPFQSRPVTPVCCLFLERQGATVPRLTRLAGSDLSRRFAQNLLFIDDDQFAQQHAVVFDALGRLPAYHLAYGSDPSTAATFLRELLASHNISEGKHPSEACRENLDSGPGEQNSAGNDKYEPAQRIKA